MGEFPLGLRLPHSFGRYLLQERIGGGGMASVYRASLSAEGGFEKEVAVKVIRSELSEDPQFIRMFLDEARLSGALSHPNIAQTFDFGQVGGTYYLAMELVRGRTLSAILETLRTQGLRLGASASLFVAKELARALDYAHRLKGPDGAALGIVHRDVSPQNVLISRDGDVKLVDFGIAKAALRSQVTQPGRVRGKCSYMAPEQARGGEVDAKVDVFALGILLWECVAGRKLFDGSHDAEVLLQVLEKDIPPPSVFAPGTVEEVDDLILRFLRRDPAARPASSQAARELADLAFRLARSPDDFDLVDMQQRLATATAAVSRPDIELSSWRISEESRAQDFPWTVNPSARTLVPEEVATSPRRGPREEGSPEERTRLLGGGSPGARPGKVMLPVAIASALGALVAILATSSWKPQVAPPRVDLPASAMPSDSEQGGAMPPAVVGDVEDDALGAQDFMEAPQTADDAPGQDSDALLALAEASPSPPAGVPPHEGKAAAAGPQPSGRGARRPPPPRPEAAKGRSELVLSTRLRGATVAVDGEPPRRILPHAPLSLEVGAGSRRLVFQHEEGGLRCAVEVGAEPSARLALLFDGSGVARLQGNRRLPLPCM